MSEYKKQHYVPETYLNAWQDETGKLYQYDKNSNKLMTHSYARNLLYKKYLYTKTVDDIPILSQEEKKQIFSCLNDYDIYYNHDGIKKHLEDFNDYADYYYDFDNWDILKTNGQITDKESLKKEIKNKKINKIEVNWKCIENDWDELMKDINYIVNNKPSSLNNIHREKLIEFMVVQSYRTLMSLKKIKELYEYFLAFLKLDNYLDEEYFNNITESFGEMYFKKQMELYQEGKEGIISHDIKLYKNNSCITFIKSIGKDFISSDNPVFTINDANFYNGKYNAIYFPITPNLMIALCRGNNRKYSIIEMKYQKVRKFNKKIKDNSFKYYITNYKK